jgi:hypothetical protein
LFPRYCQMLWMKRNRASQAAFLIPSTNCTC